MLNAYDRAAGRPVTGGWIALVRSGQSARGLAHAQTLRARGACGERASVLECGGPPPLWLAPNCKRAPQKLWRFFILHFPFFIFKNRWPARRGRIPRSLTSPSPAEAGDQWVKSVRVFTVKLSPIKVNQAASIQPRYGQAPSESGPVRPGQTFEIFKNRLPLRRPLFLHSSFFIFPSKTGGFKVIQGYSRLNFFSPCQETSHITPRRSPVVHVRPCQSMSSNLSILSGTPFHASRITHHASRPAVRPAQPFNLMNLTRNGKIARLPQPLREELNRRLDQGAQGSPLLQWLNSLPEVRAVLAADFEGRPINKQSLSQWRRGGYTEWLRQQEALAMAGQRRAETGKSQPAGLSPSTDHMAAWIAARCLLAVRDATGPGGAEAAPLKILHEACRDLVALRQANHTAARGQFDLVRCQLLSGLQLAPAAPCPESQKMEPAATHDQPAIVAPVSKPACRGHAKPLPNNPATRFYSAGLCRPAPPSSAPVRPGQTFEILNFPMNPQRVGKKSPPSWPRISDFGFLSDFGLRPSDFPSSSAPVRPGQTFEILNFATNRGEIRRLESEIRDPARLQGENSQQPSRLEFLNHPMRSFRPSDFPLTSV